jgi:hypothetical protein
MLVAFFFVDYLATLDQLNLFRHSNKRLATLFSGDYQFLATVQCGLSLSYTKHIYITTLIFFGHYHFV